MKSFSVLLLFSILLSSLPAFADGEFSSAEVGLPSDFGPVSIDASRRAVQSKIQDWSDDRQDIKSRRMLVCAIAGTRSVILGPLGPVQALIILGQLPRYLGGNPALNQGGPSAPFNVPLQELAKSQTLTPGEQKTVQRLMERETIDLTDRIRLFIDTESFLIKVSTRLYQVRIDFHIERTHGIGGFFRSDTELCMAYTLQAERDSQLIQAANRVLAFYDFLEQELAD